MSINKLLGGVIILLSCGYIGFSSASAVKTESSSLRKLLHALDYMSCELQYKITPLPELCRHTAEETSGKLKEVFIALSEELENQISPDVKSCMSVSLTKVSNLPVQTKKCLLQLGASMGRFDLSGQINSIESVRSSCRRSLENLESDKDSRLRTYRTLGICAGAAMVILFS